MATSVLKPGIDPSLAQFATPDVHYGPTPSPTLDVHYGPGLTTKDGNLELNPAVLNPAFIDMTPTSGPVPPKPSPISIADITDPASLANYRNPNAPVIPDVSKIDTTFELTEPEKKVQGEISSLQELTKRLAGQSTFRSFQEENEDLAGKKKTLTDLSSRLTALKNEALAIPLQLQQDATGRGITAGGLRPIETAALRNNAIQALSVNSLFEAAKGNLTTALDLVDRAVAAKYGPIKEEIEIKRANLDLILNSPEYTLAEKKRAQAQKDAQDAKKAALDKQEAEAKEISKIAVDAASKGADALTLRKINEAETAGGALEIAAARGFAAKRDGFELSAGQTRYEYDPGTGTYKAVGSIPSNERGEFTPTEYRKLEQAGLLDQPRETQLDFLYGRDSSFQTDGYETARQFVIDNPAESRETLRSELMSRRKELNLDVSAIDTILDETGVIKEKVNISGKEKDIAVALVKAQGFGGSAQTAKDYILGGGAININGSEVVLSKRQAESIVKEIDAAYPSGKRSFWNSIFPGGK